MEYPILTWTVAIIATVIGFGSLIHFTWIGMRWPRTTGRVVDNFSVRSRSGGASQAAATSYFPRIAFQTPDGKDFVVKGDVGRRTPYDLESEMTVWYKPSHPAHAMTMKIRHRLIFSGAFIIVALVCWALIAGIIDGNGRFI